MSSYEKVIKLACKPKAAPPKAKYLDNIIAATWSEDGAVHDVCRALAPRFREPNVVVVFKALIVLHTMIRNGATDNILQYLSSNDILRLGNVASANWEGYTAPQNLQNYAMYLDSRIRAYRELKHDAIRVQAESNRDMRNSASIEEDAYVTRHPKKSGSMGPTRSKTIMGRKLRVMTVEKGLLRETKAVHRMIDSLLECRFYLDDLEDELTTTALRMLVKDLLILFQAGNEGVINVLEHYFEMSHIDAQSALSLYRHFCKQTERVVEYLGVAKKLQNLLNVPIPNLKHAPVSLAGALQEYLEDPNFEDNRREYRAAKAASEGKPVPKEGTSKKEDKPSSDKPSLPVPTSSASGESSNAAQSTGKKDPMVDFFSAIEEEQPTMFNPQTGSPNAMYFQQQAASNPFVQRQMMTGQPFGMQGVPQIQTQPTGFIMPQQTAMPMGAPNPFALQAPQPQPQARLLAQPTGHRPFSSFIQPQATGFLGASPMPQSQSQPTGFLQPQATGSNPFRQSMLLPQMTGQAAFGGMGPGSSNPFPGPGQSFSNPPTAAPNAAFSPTSSITSPYGQQPFSAPASNPPMGIPARPASTPLTSNPAASTSSATSPPIAQPVKTHQTGTRNPFGPVTVAPPAVPKAPTLMELAMGARNGTHINGTPDQNAALQQQQQQPQQMQPQQTGAFGGMKGFDFSSSALNPGATDMASVASSFSFNKSSNSPLDGRTGTNQPGSQLSSPSVLNAQDTATTSSSLSTSFNSMLLSSQPTGATATSNSSVPSFALTPALKQQTTGFAGLKPFKPSSAFGASLAESLPPIPGSAPTTPGITGNGTTSPNGGSTSAPSGAFPFSNQPHAAGGGALNSQPTGAMGSFGSTPSLGVGLRPQMTGGAANPFRASMFASSTSGLPSTGNLPSFSASGLPPSFTGGPAGGSFGSAFNPNGQQQQPNGHPSLI